MTQGQIEQSVRFSEGQTTVLQRSLTRDASLRWFTWYNMMGSTWYPSRSAKCLASTLFPQPCSAQRATSTNSSEHHMVVTKDDGFSADSSLATHPGSDDAHVMREV